MEKYLTIIAKIRDLIRNNESDSSINLQLFNAKIAFFEKTFNDAYSVKQTRDNAVELNDLKRLINYELKLFIKKSYMENYENFTNSSLRQTAKQ